MIKEDDILPFGRFKYPQPYTGSANNLRYRIIHPKPAEGEANLIYVDIWQGPYSYENTDSKTFIRKSFEYSLEGYNEIVPYLNSVYEQDKEKWEN